MSTKPVEYVCAFAFDEERKNVALVRKARPDWQRGRWNGIGGKVEPHETAGLAVRREFREETGLDISGWRHFATLTATPTGQVIHFFEVTTPALHMVRTATDEKIKVHEVARLRFEKCVTSVAWLIPLACDTNKSLTFTWTTRDPRSAHLF